MCGQVAELCGRYGALVEDTHRAVRRAVGIMLATGAVAAATGIGLAVVAHVELAEVEALLNPAADDFAARLPAEVLPAVDPGLAASVEQLAAGTATPEAVEAELTELEDATDAQLGGTAVPPPVDATAQVVPRFTADHFVNQDKTEEHVRDHAQEFGLTTEEEYVRAATDFLQRAQDQNLAAVIDKRGTGRVYDPASNTIASYDSTNGVIKTYFRPTSPAYWARRSPGWGAPVNWE